MIPKYLLSGEGLKRPLYRPRKRFKDNLKDNRNALYKDMQFWEDMALNLT